MQPTTFNQVNSQQPIPTRAMTLKVIDHGTHSTYKSIFRANGKVYELKVLPIYRAGTYSMLDMKGSARVEICEKTKNDWVQYRLAYTNLVKANFDLGRSITSEINKALIQLNIMNEFDAIRVEFEEKNALRTIAA